ncbi:ArnT family glycosyltransferase [Methanosphaera sp.]
MNLRLTSKNFWILPTIMVLILALIVTLSSNWPLSWDIYIHINYAITYLHHGLTSVDPYLNAPHGKVIGYSPLFHILLIMASSFTQGSLINAARLFQIIVPLICVLIVMFISYKLHDELAGFTSGLLLISSFIFTRMLLPIPESIAILFFIIGIYFFYLSTIENNSKVYVLFSAIIALLILAVHFSSFIYYVILLTALMITHTVIDKRSNAFKSYIIMGLVIGCIGIVALFLLFSINSHYLSQVLDGIFSITSDPFSLFINQKAMGLERYVKCIGILPLIFGIIGLYYSFKNKELMFISCWALITFIFSNLHWFGIPVHTFRMLIYFIMPTVILGGYGVSKLAKQLSYKNSKIGLILIILLIILSFGFGYSAINDSSTTNSSTSTEISTFQIAPPTSDEIDVINWFSTEDTQNKSILTNNQYFGTVISSVDEIPLHYAFDIYTNKSLTKSSYTSLENESIGYIVYDKSLVLNNSTEKDNLNVRYVNGSYYPSYYFTKEINENNFETIKLSSTEKVFENNRFIICKVK